MTPDKVEKREPVICEWGEHYAKNSKYTDTRVVRFLSAIADGNSIETSAALASVNDSTIYRWFNEFPGLREETLRAKAQFEQNCLASVQAQVRGGQLKKRRTRIAKDGETQIMEEEWTLPDGRLALEALARRNKKTWGQTNQILVGEMTDAELKKALEEEGVLERLSDVDGAEPGEEV